MSNNRKSRKPTPKVRDKGGRPEWRPTLEQRNQVAIAAGGGMSHDEIASALCVSRNTLEKHCGEELSRGANQKRLEVVNAQHKAAVNGNVSAQKAYLANVPVLSAPPPLPLPDKKKEKLGKKEQAQADAGAAAAGTEWNDLLPRHGETPTKH